MANHTTPIDVIILASDCCYSLVQHFVSLSLCNTSAFIRVFEMSRVFVFELGSQVGQMHRGLLGMIQRGMVKSSPHIWFDRSEVKDRHLVAKR